MVEVRQPWGYEVHMAKGHAVDVEYGFGRFRDVVMGSVSVHDPAGDRWRCRDCNTGWQKPWERYEETLTRVTA